MSAASRMGLAALIRAVLQIGTITTTRGNTLVAAANAATTLAVLGADTAATPVRVPPGQTSLTKIRATYASNGATVGASVCILHITLQSGDYWLVIGASGGQNATGEGNNKEPSDVINCNVPVVPGESFAALEVFVQGTDDGTQVAVVELTFDASAQGPRSRFDARMGQGTALNTGVAMLTRGTSTAAGPFTVPADMTRIEAVIVAAACTFAAVNSANATVVVQGDGLEGGTQSFLLGAEGQTLATTGPRATFARVLGGLDAKVAPNSTIAATIFMGGVDAGEYSGGVCFQYA